MASASVCVSHTEFFLYRLEQCGRKHSGGRGGGVGEEGGVGRGGEGWKISFLLRSTTSAFLCSPYLEAELQCC